MYKGIDTIIIDLIMDHYNIQSLNGKREIMTSQDFDVICKQAEKIFYRTLLITKEPGVA